jgi:hypothetical protein
VREYKFHLRFNDPGGFGSLVKYPALVLHYSGVLLLLRRVRFSAKVTGESYYSTS